MDSYVPRVPGPVLIVTPTGRDAEGAAALLAADHVPHRVCSGVDGLVDSLATLSEVGAVMIADEAFVGADLSAISALLAQQPPWSDLPFIVLTHGTLRSRVMLPRLQLPVLLGNVMFLERPLNGITLVSAVRTALRARARQLQIREHLAQSENTAAALAASEAKLRLALAAGRLGSWEFDVGTGTLTASSACKAQFGFRPEEEFGIADWNAAIHPDDAEHQRKVVGESLRGGGTFDVEYRIRARDGTVRWIEVRGRTSHDARQRPLSVAGVCLDVTARRRAEAALRESEEHHRHTVEMNPQIPWTANPDGRLVQVNARWLDLTGLSKADALGEGWMLVIHPEDLANVIAAQSRSLSTGTPFDVEHRVRLADGSYRWFRSRARPRLRPDGSILLWYGSTEDVHDRKRSEEHMRLMVNELNHRVKNSLAMVQAIAAQSFRHAKTMADARDVFTGRLLVLAHAHDALASENWEGGYLREIVLRATAPHAADRECRFAISGPEVKIPPKMALAIAMALHELATNAVKYGSLSVEAGTVEIAWTLGEDEQRLRLLWREQGGPPVKPPLRKGFGSRMIEQGLALQLGGKVEIDYGRSGVVCTVDAPLMTC